MLQNRVGATFLGIIKQIIFALCSFLTNKRTPVSIDSVVNVDLLKNSVQVKTKSYKKSCLKINCGTAFFELQNVFSG